MVDFFVPNVNFKLVLTFLFLFFHHEFTNIFRFVSKQNYYYLETDHFVMLPRNDVSKNLNSHISILTAIFTP